MIDLKNELPMGRYQIKAYQPNEVLINETTYRSSLILSAQTLIENWRPRTVQDLLASDWEPVMAMEPKIILVGTGTRLHFPPAEILSPLIERNIGFEIMDTPAACRTFTVLMSEDRQVVAALILD